MKYHLGVVSNYQVQVFAVPVLLNILFKKKSCYVFLNMHNRNRVMESQKHKKCNFHNFGDCSILRLQSSNSCDYGNDNDCSKVKEHSYDVKS